MAEISPFRGILYNKRKVRGIKGVFSPPYDVISPEEQASLYRRHPYNVVRLILGQARSGDTRRDNRYTRAGVYFEEWQKKGVLKKDSQPFIYPYRFSFLSQGKKRAVSGVFVLLRLEKGRKKGALPHEKTHLAPKEDRFNLIKETYGNIEPIYLIFDDSAKLIKRIYRSLSARQKPVFKFQDRERTTHELFRFSDERFIERLRRSLRSKRVLIADGHHRYETALRFRDYLRKKGARSRPHPADRRLVFLADINDPGLVVLPTHRIIKGISEKRLDAFVKELSAFKAEELKSRPELFRRLAGKETHILGAAAGKKTYLLRVKTKEILNGNESRLRKTELLLDVGLLHRLIIEPLVGNRELDKKIVYTRDLRFANSQIAKNTTVFFLKPTDVREVKIMAQGGKKMPQKSTYFYPKLASGLLFYSFRER